MNVLMITGDRRFGPGNPRFELQKSAVEELAVVYWGRGAVGIPDAHGFDVVTSQDPFWRGLVAWISARKAKARLNIQVHADLSGQSFVKHILAQIVLRHADSIRVVSEKIKQQVLAIAPHARVSVLPVFVDLSKFQTMIRTPHSGKNILWMGRFEEEKDPALAIQVFKDVLRVVPDARLTMLGDGTMKQNLINLANNLAIEVPIEYPGWKTDVVSYLEKADVVLCTSRHESFGVSIVEALAAEVPVVAPDVGIAKEAGAIVAPRNELVAEVVKVLSKEGVKGHLSLTMPTAEEWKTQWRNAL